MLGALLRRRCNRVLVADVHLHRERLAARFLDLAGSGVNRARQLRMRLIALRSDRHVRAIARRASADRQTDAA
jgi:hypothetical protein